MSTDLIPSGNGSPTVLDNNELMPPILAGHATPAIVQRVEQFYENVAEIFERWVHRCPSPETQRSYRRGVMTFVEYMGWKWPEDADCLFQATIQDVQEFRDWLKEERGNAPKTLNSRMCALSNFYKYLREVAIEMRLPIQVPNPAHSQFIARGRADPLVETPALNISQARMLRSMPQGDDPVAHRDRAIIDFYIYSGVRVATGCRMRVSDFHFDHEDPTIRICEKGDKRRTMGLKIIGAVTIQEYLENVGITNGPLFPSRLNSSSRKLGNTAIKPRAMHDLLVSYLAQLPGALKDREEDDPLRAISPKRCIYHPHVLRATFATVTLGAGVDIRIVQKDLGHTQVSTTQVYDKRRRTTKEGASHSNPV